MNFKVIQKARCAWVTDDPLYLSYHDQEWGVPIYNAQLLFEFLILEGMQAGLSWYTILKKRENYRQAFDNFNAKKIVKYHSRKINSLLNNEGIIRNRLKVASIIQNAEAFLAFETQGENFSDFLWNFVGNKPVQNKWQTIKHVPSSTKESDAMAKVLKKRGFNFVGSTICYAFMQAVGMVNDHTADCFRYKEVCRLHK